MKTKQTFGTVRRLADTTRDELTKSSELLDAIFVQPSLDRARLATTARKFAYAASAPLRKMIQQDPEAITAVRRLAEIRKEASRTDGTSMIIRTGGAPFAPWSFDLQQGVHVFSPPYDIDRPGPTSGSPANSKADRNTGEFSVDVPTDNEVEGLRSASASVGIGFEPAVKGSLSVKPITQYSYSWWVTGFYLSAHTEGHIRIAAVRTSDGQIMDSRDVTLWSMTTESDQHSFTTEGTLHPSDLQVNFIAEQGKNYLVSVAVVVSGDQSGTEGVGPFPSWSFFSGSLSAKIPWLVAELRP